MILLILDEVDYPVAVSTLYDFFIGNGEYTGYTEYFSLNENINTLRDDGYIESTKSRGATFLSITDKGSVTLAEFQNRISGGIKKEIHNFLEANEMILINKASILANVYCVGAGDYVAELTAKEKYNDLFLMRINVPTEQGAQIICDNWRDASSEIYTYVLNRLLRNGETENGQCGPD